MQSEIQGGETCLSISLPACYSNPSLAGLRTLKGSELSSAGIDETRDRWFGSKVNLTGIGLAGEAHVLSSCAGIELAGLGSVRLCRWV